MTIIQLSMPLPDIQASEDEAEGRRTIKGRAVPWETEALTSTGQRVTFAKGAVTMAGIPVVLHHLPDRPVGVVASEHSQDDGLDVEVRISQVRDGDEALVLASDGVLRGWSVGVNPTEFQEREDGSLYVTASDSDHLALVMRPAFKEARVESVAASAATPKEEAVTDTAVSTEQEAPATVAAAPRTPTITASVPSVGEVMYAFANSRKDPEQFSAMQARVQAATGHILDANFDALDEKPFVGGLIDLNAPAERPVSQAFGILSAPSGVKTFVRPKMTGHLADAAAAAEKSDVTDDGIATDSDDVTMTFIKRAANVSAEAQAFSSPDVYGIVARDLVRAYLRGFEALTVASLEGGTYNSTVIAQATLVNDLHVAAGNIYDAFFGFPNLLICASDVWAKIGGMVDSDGRPLFPYTNPSNAAGSNAGGITGFGLNILGLRPVVSRTLTAGTAYLASTDAFEVYESSRVNMGPVQDPTVLGTAWGIGGAQGDYLVGAAGIEKFTLV